MSSGQVSSFCYRNAPVFPVVPFHAKPQDPQAPCGRRDGTMADIEEIARIVVNTGFRISTKLGPGLMESVYETVFARDLSRQGLFVERQKRVAFDFEGLWFDEGLTVDILVERSRHRDQVCRAISSCPL